MHAAKFAVGCSTNYWLQSLTWQTASSLFRWSTLAGGLGSGSACLGSQMHCRSCESCSCDCEYCPKLSCSSAPGCSLSFESARSLQSYGLGPLTVPLLRSSPPPHLQESTSSADGPHGGTEARFDSWKASLVHSHHRRCSPLWAGA